MLPGYKKTAYTAPQLHSLKFRLGNERKMALSIVSPLASQLRIDLQSGSGSATTLARSAQPVFSFVPEGEDAVPPRASAMSAYRLRVLEAATKALVWDSGQVASKNATAIECGKKLLMGTYSLSATWWDASGNPSPAAYASFDVGPLTEADWAGTAWYGGGGQRELRFQLPPLGNGSLARLFVAAPGGFVVSVNGTPVGDEIGISAWTEFSVRVMYEARALDGLLSASESNEVTVAMGCGFYCGKGTAGPVARLLLTTIDTDGTVRRLGGEALSLEGRAGRTVSDSPFGGTKTDWRVTPDEGWTAAKVAGVLGELGGLAPLAMSAAESRPAPQVKSVTPLGDDTWLFELPVNLVGSVLVTAGAFSGPGTLTVHHCEVLNASAAQPECAGHPATIAVHIALRFHPPPHIPSHNPPPHHGSHSTSSTSRSASRPPPGFSSHTLAAAHSRAQVCRARRSRCAELSTGHTPPARWAGNATVAPALHMARLSVCICARVGRRNLLGRAGRHPCSLDDRRVAPRCEHRLCLGRWR